MNKIYEEMSAAKIAYESALSRGSGVAVAKQRMANVAFNYFSQLMGYIEENERLRKEIEVLNVSLDEADKEIQNLKKPKRKAEAVQT